LDVDTLFVQVIETLLYIRQGLAAGGSAPRRLDLFSGRRCGTRSTGSLDRWSLVGRLPIDNPKIVTVFIAQKPGPIVSQVWLHVSVEYLFGLKKMPISVNNHLSSARHTAICHDAMFFACDFTEGVFLPY
jgi:hypothetical protein